MVNANQKALITGASGFIGSRLRSELLSRGVDVVAIRRSGSPEAKEGRSVVADYVDKASLKKVIHEERPDYILHVAGVTKGRTYEDFRKGNVLPTQNLLEAAAKEHPGVKRFVHVSSLTSYGPSTPGRPLTEDDPRKPIEFYGKSKLEAEEVVEAIENVPWTIVRPAGVYGPGDVDYFNLFKSAVKGLNVFFGNHDRWMSAIYVDDCVRGILDSAASDHTIGKGYFLADGKPTTWGAFQEEIVKTVPKRVRTLHLPEALVSIAAAGGELATRIDGKPRLLNKQKAKMGAQEAWTCSDAAAKRDFGFRAEVDVPEGVRRTHAWYVENGWY